VRCVVSRRSRRTAGATVAWVVPPAMSGQTILIKRDPREGVKKDLSDFSEKRDVRPVEGIQQFRGRHT
jgi:hypothetical protein